LSHITRSMRITLSAVAVLVLPQVVRAMCAGPTGVARPWFERRRSFQTRGVYDDRPAMPPLDEISARVGVPSPAKAPRWQWKVAWSIGRRALPLLHRWDDCAPTDTNVNLWVCWLKAIGGNSPRGYPDESLAYDLLPPVTRRVVARPLARLYPLLHHQNVALRTAFLDRHVKSACEQAKEGGDGPTVIALGAGFDLRCLRLRSSPAAHWVDIDLPHVIAQRERLLGRLFQRRPELLPQRASLRSLSANLSVAEEVRTTLRDALSDSARGGTAIIVCEALLIYLKPEDAAALLRIVRDEAMSAGLQSATLCFADRLPNSPGFGMDEAKAALHAAGFELDESTWLPKPGLAKHMGVAHWARS
jgi:hypothetical protein